MSRLASLATRRPWRVILVAVLFLGVAVVIGAPLTSNLTAGGFEDSESEFVEGARPARGRDRGQPRARA